jgi:hypothetical protein
MAIPYICVNFWIPAFAGMTKARKNPTLGGAFQSYRGIYAITDSQE